jgi:ABC-type cobalt transport system substrate-binding protein
VVVVLMAMVMVVVLMVMVVVLMVMVVKRRGEPGGNEPDAASHILLWLLLHSVAML